MLGPKARMNASLFQHGNLVNIVAYDKEASKLSRIKEIGLAKAYMHLPFKVEKSSIALFLLEVIRNSIKEQEPNPELFDFLHEWLLFLDNYEGSHSLLHVKFLCDYATYIGFKPINNWSEDMPYLNLELGHFTAENTTGLYIADQEISKSLSILLNIEKENLVSISFHKEIRMKMIEELIRFYKFHIQSFRDLKSYEILRQIF